MYVALCLNNAEGSLYLVFKYSPKVSSIEKDYKHNTKLELGNNNFCLILRAVILKSVAKTL